jgi:DNA-binding CsgD family transcriptional regulator
MVPKYRNRGGYFGTVTFTDSNYCAIRWAMTGSSAIYFYIVLAAALLSAYWAWRLSKLYRIRFLKDYFHFVLAFTGYGFLNFTGQVFLTNTFPASSFNRSVGDLIVFTLAIPLLALWLYFYLLFVTRMCLINLTRTFKIGYWIVNAILILSNFWAIQVLIETGDRGATHHILSWKVPVYLAVFFGASVLPFIFSNRIASGFGKLFARLISAFYVLGVACLVVFGDIVQLSFYADRFHYLAFISSIYFSINVLPLVYLSYSLKRHFSDMSYSQEADDDALMEFSSEFKLTKREREIIGFIVQGMSNDEIGQALYISTQTVKNNVSAIYRKTGVKNRVQLGNVLRNYEEGES